MEHFTCNLPSTALHCVKWKSKKPRAVLCLIHGMGEYAERYDTTARFFTEKGFDVYGVDLPGHGLSTGVRGDAGGTRQLLAALDFLVLYAKTDCPSKPVFLFGHSLGGNLILSYRMYRPESGVCGYIASSPWLLLCSPPSMMRLFAVKCAALFKPKRKYRVGQMVREELARQDVAEDYLRDPLLHPFLSPRTAAGRFRDAQRLLREPDKLPARVFILHGTQDSICSIEGSRLFAEKLGGRARLYPIEGAGHETMHLREYLGALESAVDFFQDVLGK